MNTAEWVQAGHALNHPEYTTHLPSINFNNKTRGIERQTNNQCESDNWSEWGEGTQRGGSF